MRCLKLKVLYNNLFLQLLILFLAISYTVNAVSNNYVPRPQMDNWVSKFGTPLNNFVQSISKYAELHGRFQSSRNSTVRPIRSDAAFATILKSMKGMLQEKVDTLKKIANWAEERAKDYNLYGRAPTKFNYVNSKRVNDDVPPDKGKEWNYTRTLDFKMNRHFSASENVNMTVSTVHVPTTTYDLDPELMRTVNWTSDMDKRFKNNYEQYPRLHFQYFCAAIGMMRQYPGIKWPFGQSANTVGDLDDPDTFDCRMRPWYISAASSHKTVLILLDTSGSMTGLRNKIANHVAFTILETLTDNDKMAVLSFSERVEPVVSCFEFKFMEATPENVRSVKQALLGEPKLEKFVNITFVLEKAFDMFQRQPTSCNKAIFLVTDGSPSTYQEIIKAKQNSTNTVRIFTYLVGREATDATNLQHMACNSHGWFSHLSTLSQVQEHVLKYIPVMSRPIVFSTSRDVSWTPIYVNQIIQPHIVPAKNEERFEYMISASLAAHETHHENTSKSATKVQFLGVAGTDIPLRELHIATNPFSLGTNGYTFLITNNGHVVFHPRWTPHVPKSDYNDYEILKPNFQAMDIGEIELVDDVEEMLWRNNDTTLLQMRREMLLDEQGSKKGLHIKIPQENFRRVTVRKQNYEYAQIPRTPYTLAIVVEDGMNQFVGRFSLTDDGPISFERILPLDDKDETNDVGDDSGAFEGVEDGWILNPTWLYCEYLQDPENIELIKNKEFELVSILKELQGSKELWNKLYDGYFGPMYKNSTGNSNKQKIFRCNKDLVEAFVFDANATQVFTKTRLWNFNEKDQKLIERYGVVKSFLTTRSGLTRWIELAEQDESGVDINSTKTEAQKLNEIMGLDSIYYQRAVDQYPVDPNSFVYTISSTNPNSVIASRAVYTTRDGLSAPVAVVGLEFNQRKWASRFFEVANVCVIGDKKSCKYKCESSEFDCFVLDDNGYVVIAEDESDNGKFFGDINVKAMEGLISANIYRRIEYYDYQSICFGESEEEEGDGTSGGNIFGTPLTHIKSIWSWLYTKLFIIVFNFFDGIFGQNNFTDDDFILLEKIETTVKTLAEKDSPFDYDTIVLCDMKYTMFKYGSAYNTMNFSHTEILPDCGHNCVSSYSTHYIPNTNLILVITDGTCSCYSSSTIDSDPFKMHGERRDYPNNCPPRAEYVTRHPDLCIDLNSPTNKEHNIRQECGKGSKTFFSMYLIIIAIAMLFLNP